MTGWSSWNEWSACSASCGSGQRQRIRTCLGGSCEGSPVEKKDCTVDLGGKYSCMFSLFYFTIHIRILLFSNETSFQVDVIVKVSNIVFSFFQFGNNCFYHVLIFYTFLKQQQKLCTVLKTHWCLLTVFCSLVIDILSV